MDKLNTEQAPRLVLKTARAGKWLDALIAVHEGRRDTVPSRYLSPSAPEVYLTATWAPRTVPSLKTAVDVENLVRTAMELGYFITLEGITVEFFSCLLEGQIWYAWQVHADRYAGLRLTAPLKPLAHLALPGAAGTQAAIQILMEATDEANEMLANLVGASATILADFSTDPVLLTRLADYDEPVVRAAAAQNTATPDAGRVLAAFHDLNGRPPPGAQ